MTGQSAVTARGPRVVALGGGHGLAVALRAIATYATEVTAVVSVADDGGSSGRLRRELGVAPPGDLRRCLVALGDGRDDNVWPKVFEYRFDTGELDGHALGNLLLVGLQDALGGLDAALDAAARLLGATGRVRPATTERVVLKAHLGEERVGEERVVEGQVAVGATTGRIRRVELVPADAPAHPDVLAALAEADQVVLAPGSLYTSLLPVLAVAELRRAVAATPGVVVQVCNLGPELPETAGLDALDHLRAVLDHGGRVDRFLVAAPGELGLDGDRLAVGVPAAGVELVTAALAGPSGLVHDARRLAAALSDLLESA